MFSIIKLLCRQFVQKNAPARVNESSKPQKTTSTANPTPMTDGVESVNNATPKEERPKVVANAVVDTFAQADFTSRADAAILDNWAPSTEMRNHMTEFDVISLRQAIAEELKMVATAACLDTAARVFTWVEKVEGVPRQDTALQLLQLQVVAKSSVEFLMALEKSTSLMSRQMVDYVTKVQQEGELVPEEVASVYQFLLILHDTIKTRRDLMESM